MAAEFDLVIRGGTVVDGTGRAPIEADVGIKGNRIAAIGTLAKNGAEEIDAKGKLVTPGFVDIHTHYDGQAVWDSRMTPSSMHGVTTAVMGNCGVGFAPCKPADREKLVELMEGVEDIPGPVMHEGLKWEWESFAEYLAALERRNRDIDLCALLPHAAVRVFVMGERAVALENANQADIAQMREIAADAMRAGAFGFSTSRSLSHKSLRGDPTPTLRAQEDELTGIAMGMRDAGSGFLEIVSEWAPDPKAEFAMLRRVVERCGRPCVFTLTQRHARPTVWRDLLGYADEAIAAGVPIRPVVAPRAIGVLLGLEGSQNPFSGTPSYKSIAHLPLAERVRRMRDPEFRRQMLSEDPKKDSTFPLFHRLSFTQMFRFGNPPNYQPRREDSLAAIAEREGPHAAGGRLRRAAGGRRPRVHLHAARQLRRLRSVGERDHAGGSQHDHGSGRRRRACRVHSGCGLPDLAADALGPHDATLGDAGTDPPRHLRYGACRGAVRSRRAGGRQEGRCQRDRLGSAGLRQAVRGARPAGRRQAADAEGARLRRDDRVGLRNVSRRRGRPGNCRVGW